MNLVNLCLVSLAARGATLTVPGDHATIQAAIDAAIGTDTIEVSPGTHVGTVDFTGKDVSVVGTGGSTSTLLLAPPATAVLVSITSGETASARLQGFRLSNPYGAELELSGTSPVLEDLHVDGEDGAGPGTTAASITGGAPSFVDCLFDANTADGPSHVEVHGASTAVSFAHTTFQAGDATQGALWIGEGSATLTGCVFADNLGDDAGAALWLGQDVTAEVIDCEFLDNHARGAGGAVELSGGGESGAELVVSGGRFVGNTAAGAWEGGAVHVGPGASLVLDGVELEANSAYRGGAIGGAAGARIEVAGCTLLDNVATRDGGGVSARAGGELSTSDSEFTGNVAGDSGGALYLTGAQAEVLDSVFTANLGSLGGGLAASGSGSVVAERNLFCANTAADGAGAVLTGHRAGATDQWSNNAFLDNLATGIGGGLVFHDRPSVEVLNNTFVGNGATVGGSLVLLDSLSEAARVSSNLVAYTASGGGVAADANTADALVPALDHNAVWANGSHLVGELAWEDLDPSNFAAEPGLLAYEPGGTCEAAAVALAYESAIRDLGDPDEAMDDADGTPNDPGATGGPTPLPVDLDRDGHHLGEDCDDSDPDVHPGAPERSNGEDDDCDGETDPDSDGDGVLDHVEESWGTLPSREDSDRDGLGDGVEWGPDPDDAPVDSDGDEVPDVLDDDSDADGVSDEDEGAVDSDGDSLPDFRDPDDDGDLIPTSTEGDGDADGDGVPNHLDEDSDGDGASDLAEGTGDGDGDGIPDYLDDGADGSIRADYDLDRGFGCATPAPPTGLALSVLALVAARRRRERSTPRR